MVIYTLLCLHIINQQWQPQHVYTYILHMYMYMYIYATHVYIYIIYTSSSITKKHFLQPFNASISPMKCSPYKLTVKSQIRNTTYMYAGFHTEGGSPPQNSQRLNAEY